MAPIRGDGESAALLRTLEGFAIYTPLTPMLRALIPDPVQKLPIGLMGGGLAEGLFSLWRLKAGGAALLEASWAGARDGTIDADDLLDEIERLEPVHG